jgi:hypothetical protein
MTVVKKEILMGELLSGGRSCWSGDGWCFAMSLGDWLLRGSFRGDPASSPL